MGKPILITIIFCLGFLYSYSQLFSFKQQQGYYSLNNPAIYVDAADYTLVKKSAELLQADIEMVTGIKPPLRNEFNKSDKNIIIIGTIAHSAFVQKLVSAKEINISAITGKWEAYRIQASTSLSGQTVLAIIGSDRRGTAFGVFEVSKQMGVSPWYWWADVPIKKSICALCQLQNKH